MNTVTATAATFLDQYESASSELEKTNTIVQAFMSAIQPLIEQAKTDGADYLHATINAPAGTPIPAHDIGLRARHDGYGSMLLKTDTGYTIRLNVPKNQVAVALIAETLADSLFSDLADKVQTVGEETFGLVAQAPHPIYELPDNDLLQHLYGRIAISSAFDSVNNQLRSLITARAPEECAALSVVYRISGSSAVNLEAKKVQDSWRCCASSIVDDADWDGVDAVSTRALFCC